MNCVCTETNKIVVSKLAVGVLGSLGGWETPSQNFDAGPVLHLRAFVYCIAMQNKSMTTEKHRIFTAGVSQ